jgi:hypothetical protein
MHSASVIAVTCLQRGAGRNKRYCNWAPALSVKSVGDRSAWDCEMSLPMLFLMSECVSPANTGGLANVARALPAALQSGGRKAR